MSDDTKRYEKPSSDGRQLSMPVATVAGLIMALVSGGLASGVTGSSTSSGLVRLETRLESMQEDGRRLTDEWRAVVLRLDARDQDLDARLRASEQQLGRILDRLDRIDPAPRPPR